MISKQKVFAFIDSQNLTLGVKNYGWDLDFSKFRIYLRDKYKVSKAYLFIGYVAGNERLYKLLREFGYELVFKPAIEYKQGNKKVIKGNVDAELVLHCAKGLYTNLFDKAIVVIGDGDFYCLIE